MRPKLHVTILVSLTIIFFGTPESRALTWEEVLHVTTDKVTDFVEFNGKLFASTAGYNALGTSHIYSTSDGVVWDLVTEGFGDPANYCIWTLCVFQGKLYAATANESGTQIWRSDDGVIFTKVVDKGFGVALSKRILKLIVYGQGIKYLYAGVCNSLSEAKIYRSPDGLVWDPVMTDGFGTSSFNSDISNFADFNGYLYASLYGKEIWRSRDGINWNLVVSNGLGYANRHFWGFSVYQKWLYVGSDVYDPGPRIWRTLDGTAWDSCISAGFDGTNDACFPLLTVPGRLYAGTIKGVDGGEIWSTDDGIHWVKENISGFGKRENVIIQSMHLFSQDNRIYAGTGNNSTDAEIWRSVDTIHIVDFPDKTKLSLCLLIGITMVWLVPIRNVS